MSKPCSICSNKNRDQIDKCLLAKTSYRNIKERFNVSLGALNRHVNEGHIQEILKEAHQESEAKKGLDIQSCAQEIYDLSLSAAKEAKRKDLRAFGSCLAPAAKMLEVLNKGNEGSKEPPKESAFWKSYRERAGEVFDKQT